MVVFPPPVGADRTKRRTPAGFFSTFSIFTDLPAFFLAISFQLSAKGAFF
jgi:hypothetical protein